MFIDYQYFIYDIINQKVCNNFSQIKKNYSFFSLTLHITISIAATAFMGETNENSTVCG